MTTKEAYYTTSYRFSTASTSTAALRVWKELSEQLAKTLLPMTAAQLNKATGLTKAQLDATFDQNYYQRFYGFRRFNSLEAWRDWAETTGVLYVPGLHDAPSRFDDDDEAEYDETAE